MWEGVYNSDDSNVTSYSFIILEVGKAGGSGALCGRVAAGSGGSFLEFYQRSVSAWRAFRDPSVAPEPAREQLPILCAARRLRTWGLDRVLTAPSGPLRRPRAYGGVMEIGQIKS